MPRKEREEKVIVMEEEVPGSAGTSASLALRLDQTVLSLASLLFMSLGVQFYSSTSFWYLVTLCRYLVTIMGLNIPWSFTLALVDGYSLLVKCPFRQRGILMIIVIGDWLLSILTLAAACSAASVVDLLMQTGGSYCPPKLCSRYQVSAAMAFLSWFLSCFFTLQPLVATVIMKAFRILYPLPPRHEWILDRI